MPQTRITTSVNEPAAEGSGQPPESATEHVQAKASELTDQAQDKAHGQGRAHRRGITLERKGRPRREVTQRLPERPVPCAHQAPLALGRPKALGFGNRVVDRVEAERAGLRGCWCAGRNFRHVLSIPAATPAGAIAYNSACVVL